MSDLQDETNIQTTVHDFYFEVPLYDAIKIANLEEDFFKGTVDAYNPEGEFDTTYEIYTGGMDYGWNNYFKTTLTCKRKGHKLRFFTYCNSDTVVKLGQDPSLADLQFATIGKKYDKLLSPNDLQEFKKAIGLAAHGVGAGSFIYLRRIFENLIKQTFGEHISLLGMREGDFKNKRMDERVDLLKAYLPSQLVEMKKIYGVLSDGVHNLSEQECLTYFPALKLSIELILDQRIEIEDKKKRDLEAKKQIENISKQLGKNR